ncbi:PAS domain-containing sensor histidine kinase [Desulfovibrio mangrovi]|uniref:sensor histidine kinase n=1 Tax=Desulfovibrio mangrovi TaxID=2976983 RepID=UPI002247CC58|nr:PAS domain-containing sensor histidine kinase [Desulfovibrio mangrovi]UZP66983.1 PAS domain-containing sensor histidine kinase [Desulfovibrio mangrovi]
MTQEQIIQFQEKQLELLRRERAAAMEALDLAASLGSFAPSLSQHSDCLPILRETCLRARKMIEMEGIAIYLAQEGTYDFSLHYCDNPEVADKIEHEINGLIADNSFAYALKTNEPLFFLTQNGGQHILLHVISSASRIKGMLAGILRQDKDSILDTTRKLFSVVMLSAAHAMESHDVNKLFAEDNKRLEHKVQIRTHALEDTNLQLKLIFNSIQTGVLIINAETQIIHDANPAALAMLHCNADDLIGKPCASTICFEHQTNCPFHSDSALRHNTERTLRTISGNEIPIIENVNEIMLSGQRYFLKSFMNISEQKKLQQLKEDVERITRHDLKSPLNGIINLPDIINEVGPINDEQKEMLKHIKESGYKMLKVINMSLDLYKMETGAYTFAPAPVDILQVMHKALMDLAPLFSAMQLTHAITLDGSPQPTGKKILVKGEETLLYSLLSNLLTNAAEASPREHHISVGILAKGERITVDIHNFGVIPAEIRDKFFGKYVTFGKKGGTGLGTFSAKLITNTLGGSISFTTSETAGTCITVTLPTP